MLLYSGALPPASVVPCSRSNAAADSHFHQKTKKNPKAEMRSKSRKSTVPLIPPDNSVNDSVIGYKLGISKPGHRPTTSTISSVHHNSPLNKETSTITETVRNNSHLLKNAQPQAKLKTSKCSLRHHLRATDDPEDQQKKRNIVSLSTAAVSEETPSSTSSIPVNDPGPNIPAQIPPHMGRPAWADTHESGHEAEPKS